MLLINSNTDCLMIDVETFKHMREFSSRSFFFNNERVTVIGVF